MRRRAPMANRVAGGRFAPAREPRLRSLLAAQSCVSAADAMFTVSLAGSLFFAVSVDAARLRILLYLVFTLAPFAVVGPVIGPLIDTVRGGHRTVVVAAALARAVACALVAGSLDTLLFFPAAFAVLVLGKTTSIARSALLPRLLDDTDHLVFANALVSRAAAIGGMAGGGIGALLLRSISAPAAVLAAGAGYVAAALLAARLNPSAPPTPPGGVVAEVAELAGARLGLAAAAMSMVRFAAGFVTFHTAFALKEARQPVWLFGVVLLAGTIASFSGSVLGPALRRRVSEEALLRGAVIAVAAVGVLAAGQGARSGALLITLVLGLAGAVAQPAFAATVQRLAPDAELGRAFARFDARFQLVWVVGAIGPVLGRPPRAFGYLLLGASMAVFAAAYTTVRRSTDRRRSTQDAPSQREADAALLALAHALTAQGQHDVAVLTAVDAARAYLVRTRSGAPLPPELQRSWRRVVGGEPTDEATAATVIEAAERLTGSVRPTLPDLNDR